MVEVRVDMRKFFYYYRRPDPRGATNIGSWVSILDFIGWVSAATNIAIICFVTHDLDELTGTNADTDTKLGMFVLLEHGIIDR
eukprot:UN19472